MQFSFQKTIGKAKSNTHLESFFLSQWILRFHIVITDKDYYLVQMEKENYDVS